MHGWMHAWMDACIDGWMDRMDESTHPGTVSGRPEAIGYKCRYTYIYIYIYIRHHGLARSGESNYLFPVCLILNNLS